MKTLIVGTCGHIDHGKTSLIKALTGIDTDRLKEEKRRGRRRERRGYNRAGWELSARPGENSFKGGRGEKMVQMKGFE